MAKSNAERQKAYRASRHQANDGNGQRRINTFVATKAALALNRLARHYAVTQREMLERLIEEADNALVSTMDDAQFEHYINGAG